MTKRFTGLIPPLVTPFTTAGEVDLPALDRVVDHLIDGGMDGLFVLGSTGETAYLTDAQRDAILDRVVQRANGRVPVIAGAIDMTGKRVADQALRAQKIGVDAVVAAAPVYAINDQNEIADQFRIVRDAIDLPLLAYDVPVRTNKVKLGLETLIQLGKEEVIVGVKDSSGDDVAFRRLVAANKKIGNKLSLLTGHECVVDGMLLLGADGVVPGYANVDPVRYRKLYDAAAAGDWAVARQLQDEICAGFEIVFVAKGRSGDAAGVGAFKTAMAELGILENNVMAPPVKALDGVVAAEIRRLVAEVIKA